MGYNPCALTLGNQSLSPPFVALTLRHSSVFGLECQLFRERRGRLQVEGHFTIAEFSRRGVYVDLNFVPSGVGGILGTLGHPYEPPSTCALSELLTPEQRSVCSSVLFLPPQPRV